MTDVTGLILAGGQSRRMGRDKAKLTLGGVDFLTRAKAVLHDAGCDKILVSGPDGLLDRIAHAGPLGGLDAAVAHLSDGEILLVIPVDMPKIEAGLLRHLIAAANDVHFAQHPLPFLVRVTELLRMHLDAVLHKSEADRSLFFLFRQLGFAALSIPKAAGEQFENCNTMKEYEALGERG